MLKHSIQRTGVTLIEILIVIAIIGVIVAMTVPAVQRVRNSAARLECANNLKQIGLAAHQFHNNRNSFPPGLNYQSFQFPKVEYLSWLGFLLPYIEQDALWTQTMTAYQQTWIYFANPPHVGLGTPITIFACPMDGRVSEAYLVVPQLNEWVALTSYVGVMGKDLFTLNGVLYENSFIRIADISDGTSQTLFAGERPPGPGPVYRGRWYADPGQNFDGSTGNIMGVREKNIGIVRAGSCPPGYYDFAPGRFNDPCDIFHFWSPHDGGANFVFCDGSVRFLSYGVAPLMPALASRAGEEVVEVP